MAKETSKRAQAISIMTKFKDKPMDFTVAKIADAIDVTVPNAKSYYRYIVANKLAPGEVAKSAAPAVKATVTSARAPAAAKTPAKSAKSGSKKPAAKAAPKTTKKSGKSAARAPASSSKEGDRASGQVASKDPVELAAIKERNLERLRKVSATRGFNGRVARPEGSGVENFDPTRARQEVADLYDDLAEFALPAFLTKGQLKAVV